MLHPGLYEQIINECLHDELTQLNDAWHCDKGRLDRAESAAILGQYMGRLLARVMAYLDHGDTAVRDRVSLCNAIIRYVIQYLESSATGRLDPELIAGLKGQLIHRDAEMLLELIDRSRVPVAAERIRPETPLSVSSLFTGDKREPSMMAELKKEIATSDRIDFLVSFIKFSGLRLLLEELKAFTGRGGRLRVITTSYMGATDYKAVQELAKLPNTEVKISYDTQTTRLHAKAYLFWRDTGFSTLYIGSSNISESAMTSGLEWNVRLSQQDAPELVRKVEVTFEHYWHNPEFVTFIPGLHEKELRRALKAERSWQSDDNSGAAGYYFDIQPYYYQQEILDKLQAEREVHGRYRNLVVAATGTGKTVISAFDYRRFCREHPGRPNRLLFVAHRREILQQSLACFRSILRDLNFGDILVAGQMPEQIDHLFVSIQSLNSRDLFGLTQPDYYDFIIVDEFHHAAAPSYQQLLEYYKPRVLLGLTATPERADGKRVTDYFDGRVAAEIRLYEAIERKLLSPFHYFGVTDSVDLSEVRWRFGKYDEAELEKVYVLEERTARERARYVFEAVERYCTDIRDVIGIGFCVSRRHAAFMAGQFNAFGVPSEYLTADSPDDVRDMVKRRLTRKEIHFVFVVDLYNEGVDIPEVNTVLFLRPTESLTVFLQQLGRGLRLCEGKEALTVLDFVGQAHREYNFEQRFQALLPRTRRSIVREIEQGFANVPKGCSIILERQAQEIILSHIRASINNLRNIRRKVVDYFTHHREWRIGEFFEDYHVKPLEVYGRQQPVTVYGLGVRENVVVCGEPFAEQREKVLAGGLERLSFCNSARFIRFALAALERIREGRGRELGGLDTAERRMLLMLYYTFWNVGLSDLEGQPFGSVEEALYWLVEHPLAYGELCDLLRYQYERIDIVGRPIDGLDADIPLDLYCNYTTDQILAALGRHQAWKHRHFQEGVLYVAERNMDVFFVTLVKSERDYSPTTMYQDYAVNERVFHWQSQSRTTVGSPTGRRYVSQGQTGHPVLFFVREKKRTESGVTMPYTCVGLADYRSHRGSAPISMEWTMREPLPAFVLDVAGRG